MDENLIRITPNLEKAKSILKMVEKTMEMVKKIDISEFSSNITKEYYDIIRELISVILLLDGYKTYGEGAHKRLIEYLKDNYSEFEENEINLIDELRKTRNKIAYDGFFIEKDYIVRKKDNIRTIINKLNKIINDKLQ